MSCPDFSAYTVGLITLGCKVNQYESEAIAERFAAEGFRIAREGDVCDITVVNTCTVTAESDRKARQMIRRAVTANPDGCIRLRTLPAWTSSAGTPTSRRWWMRQSG